MHRLKVGQRTTVNLLKFINILDFSFQLFEVLEEIYSLSFASCNNYGLLQNWRCSLLPFFWKRSMSKWAPLAFSTVSGVIAPTEQPGTNTCTGIGYGVAANTRT